MKVNADVWKDKSEIPPATRTRIFILNNGKLSIKFPQGGDVNWSNTDNRPWEMVVKWCYLDDLLQSYTDIRAENAELKKELSDTQAGLCCGHCNQTAKASHIWAEKNNNLQAENERHKKALDIAKELYLKKCETIAVHCCNEDDSHQKIYDATQSFRKVGIKEFATEIEAALARKEVQQ